MCYIGNLSKLVFTYFTTKNSTNVDAVSGASATSRAIKDVVNNALKQVKVTKSTDANSDASTKRRKAYEKSIIKDLRDNKKAQQIYGRA